MNILYAKTELEVAVVQFANFPSRILDYSGVNPNVLEEGLPEDFVEGIMECGDVLGIDESLMELLLTPNHEFNVHSDESFETIKGFICDRWGRRAVRLFDASFLATHITDMMFANFLLRMQSGKEGEIDLSEAFARLCWHLMSLGASLSILRGLMDAYDTGYSEKFEEYLGSMSGAKYSELEAASESDLSRVNVNITNSRVGYLHTGHFQDVQSISINVATLEQSGHGEIANALETIARAVAAANEISDDQKKEYLDQINELGKEAVLDPDRRLNPGVINAILKSLAISLGAIGGLAEIWSTWGPDLSTFFGL